MHLREDEAAVVAKTVVYGDGAGESATKPRFRHLKFHASLAKTAANAPCVCWACRERTAALY